jgi:hypothetical protein
MPVGPKRAPGRAVTAYRINVSLVHAVLYYEREEHRCIYELILCLRSAHKAGYVVEAWCLICKTVPLRCGSHCSPPARFQDTKGSRQRFVVPAAISSARPLTAARKI